MLLIWILITRIGKAVKKKKKKKKKKKRKIQARRSREAIIRIPAMPQENRKNP